VVEHDVLNRAARSRQMLYSWSFPKPIERIELLRSILRFRVLLKGVDANRLEVVR
jgi:hypothetical protein